MKIVTAIAPVNIAVIKYWGKRDEDLILPINDSFSTTLNSDDMCAKTTVMASPNFTEDKFWLNGKIENFYSKRLNNCIKTIRNRIKDQNSKISEWKIHICSENNFPTAAGLASSAAGYACLVYALKNLYGIDGDISAIARQGSGSACRSIYGGWVQWFRGKLEDGSDSIAKQIFPPNHWPEIKILILVVNDNRKKYSSTFGMKQSVLTSELIHHRAKHVVPNRLKNIIDAVRHKNFEMFAQLTMKDSNQFHAICCDTYPPCYYMNDVSHAIIDMVHAYNEFKGVTKLAYTFDAGPNACLYLQESDMEEVISLVNKVFPTDKIKEEYYRGIPLNTNFFSKKFEDLPRLTSHAVNCLKYIIYTSIGDGPKLLDDENHLLDINGFPKNFEK